jgi:anti-anti-sigma factor
MTLQAETDKISPDIAVVRFSGKMTFEETGAFASPIRALLGQGAKKIILDLSGVERIDSVGGIALVRCFFAARDADAGLCVACASRSVKRLFQTAAVDTLIPFFSSTAAASQHLRHRSETKG